jgi:hypothetical protein
VNVVGFGGLLEIRKSKSEDLSTIDHLTVLETVTILVTGFQ